jgi:nitric oxide reductase activation protein
VVGNVRKQLGHLRPELLRKVKGMDDGEELDLEKAIEARVDRRAGLSPSERIYVQRQRKDRDVSALFLLDMSASTDDRITLPQDEAAAVPTAYDDDDFLHDYYGAALAPDERKRIIDVEKEAVVLMAEALEDLGDNYAVCGFSGYGRDRVEFYVCKDFTEPYNLRVKGRIGGVKPCRSTRMGPAIRHATRRLVATESRIKALMIISDGYPQDFDYGKDRNSKDYGIKDTTMALMEARQQGVQAFCLTVDPSGHDYLREMCPDRQYMVIQDINQLPGELSKVYRSLTA